MRSTNNQKRLSERLQHALWAGLIALVLSVSTLLNPVDELLWVLQSRLASFQPSGDIVYIGSEADLTDRDFPNRRVKLAEALRALEAAGTDRVYIDMVFDQETDVRTDDALNAALRSWKGNAYLVRTLATGLDGEDRLERSVSVIDEGVPEVATDRWRNVMGYVWRMPYALQDGEEVLPTLPAAIAGIHANSEAHFPINYGFDFSAIPTYSFDEVSAAANDGSSLTDRFAGKTVLIGQGLGGAPDAPNIPGLPQVPTTIVDIFAAETLKAGYTQLISGLAILLGGLALLCIAALIGRRPWRYAGYLLTCIVLPTALVATALLGAKAAVAGAMVMLLAYTAFRARTKWRQSFRLVDEDTGLPTFAALEADKETAETVPAIIVAKIHRFEEVRKTLPSELHAEYMMRIIGRLKAAKDDATIYIGPGHLIAWALPEKEPALIREHLEGLRALFSSPLQVGKTQVDVGITFGVDLTPSPNVARRVATAVSAAERTTETYEPIEIAELASDEDLFWNISLQARIDAALANGEIYLAYQPKVFVPTGELIGVEALVRWRDPVKGLIPPDHFIRQCENAGRMNHLTRHVLQEACETGNAFEDAGLKLPIAVNISATLVHERGIVTMVREVLEETGFDPHRLTLEITETYRISNFEQASEVLGQLASLGAKLSMDDFGVGAASLEALLRLPFSELKIDRIFTQSIKDDEKAAGIVRNVLNLGKDLRIIVVAEGVEDETTLTNLRDSGCVVAQGFGICRPVSFEEILKFEGARPSESLRNMV